MNPVLGEWRKAQNLDDAWSNFDPYYPLPSGSPFYVKRKDSPLDEIKRALLRKHRSPQKYFFSGFTGCGKSTELNRLEADRSLQEKFFVVKFSVRETCDPNNLSYVDLLVAIGAKIFESYVESGGTLDQRIYDEITMWGRQVKERISTKGVDVLAKTEAGLESPRWLVQFFLKLTGKIQAEYSSRRIIREVLEPMLTELISQLNLVTRGILEQQKKHVLVLVDDLDKLLEPDARTLFRDNLSALLQPEYYAVYTVPISVFYSPEFPVIQRPKAFLLPNIKLHSRGDRSKRDRDGYETMRELALRRMDEALITKPALDEAIRMSGGVFRELARILQISIDLAIERGGGRVQRPDVKRAVTELRNEFRCLLKEEDHEALSDVYARNAYDSVDRIRHLMERLLVLEYQNQESWLDVHPVLEAIVEAWRNSRDKRSSLKGS